MKNNFPNSKYQTSEHYISGAYWQGREDAESNYKVCLVDSILKKSKIPFFSRVKAAEVGCGQGAFLFPLADYFFRKDIEYQLLGYDISSQAIALAKERNKYSNTTLDFFNGSADAVPNGLDFIFCMDVLEHVENPLEILRSLSGKSKYLILHLPIEQSIGHLLMQSPSTSYNTFKHLHFYSWETAKILINESPFELVDYQFTAADNVSLKLAGSPISRSLRIIRYFAYRFNSHLATILGGGTVLLLLQNR